MDISIILFTLLPLVLGLGIYLARPRRFRAHRNLQAATLGIVLLTIVLFELDIRLSGGTGAFLAHSSMNPSFVRNFLRTHVAVALVTAGMWIWLAVQSWRKYSDELPGKFSRRHRNTGWITFIGVCLLSSSGCALYVFLFVV